MADGNRHTLTISEMRELVRVVVSSGRQWHPRFLMPADPTTGDIDHGVETVLRSSEGPNLLHDIHDTLLYGRLFDAGDFSYEKIADAARAAAKIYPDRLALGMRHPFDYYCLTYTVSGDRFLVYVCPEVDDDIEPCAYVCFECWDIDDALRIAGVALTDEGSGSTRIGGVAFGTKTNKEIQEIVFTRMHSAVVVNSILLHALASRAPSDDVKMTDAEKNRSRARGIKLYRSYQRVPLSDYVTVVAAAPQAREPKGGTHASPSPHERRGHYRNYRSGRRGWVRAALVNAKMGFFTRDNYRLPGDGERPDE